MRRTGTPLALFATFAIAMLVCIGATSQQDQDLRNENNSGDRYDTNGHKTHNLDSLGGSNIVRDLKDSQNYNPYSLRSYNEARRNSYLRIPSVYNGYYSDLPKRNFDEIDRTAFDTFMKKRNFDEIDNGGMVFPFGSKRLTRFYYNNEPSSSGFLNKRNFDEIEQGGFQFPMAPYAIKRYPKSLARNYLQSPMSLVSDKGMDYVMDSYDVAPKSSVGLYKRSVSISNKTS